MNQRKESSAIRRLFGRRDGINGSTRAATVIGPLNVVNDAAAYGVSIKSAVVAAGTFYWQAVRIHHLSPQENGGNHHIYLDVYDPTLPGGNSPYGVRVTGARLRVTWEGGEQVVTIDKPANEPGANFPMWKWQVCAVQALGLPGDTLLSDQVTGLHTGHPDEATGNTLFHHSFGVTFVKVKAAAQISTESVIHGVIHRAAGRKVQLRKNGVVIASQTLDAAEAFRFTGLAAGQYTIAVEGTEFLSNVVTLDGRNTIQLDLTLVVSESTIYGKVKNGAGRTVRLLRGDVQVKTQGLTSEEQYRFSGLAEGTYRVGITGTEIISPPITVNGINSATADLIAAAPAMPLGHYVLFGSANQSATRANLLLAAEYLLTFKAAFGFDPAEAGQAGMVTIIGTVQAVASSIEQELKAKGIPVQRITGTVEEVARMLAARVASKNPFA